MKEYTVSKNEKGFWYAHPIGHNNEKVWGSESRSMCHALQSCAEQMGMTYNQYIQYREAHIKKSGGYYGHD